MNKDKIEIVGLPQDLYEDFLEWESKRWFKGSWIVSIHALWSETGTFVLYESLVNLIDAAEARRLLSGPLAMLAEAGMKVIVLDLSHPADKSHLN